MPEGHASGGRRLLLCDCEGSMAPDAAALGAACALKTGHVHHQLCRREIAGFRQALDEGGEVVVACAQEAPVFAELADEAGAETALRFVDIRDRAGWGEDGAAAGAKMAALVAESLIDVPPTPGLSLASEGIALVYGPAEVALTAARSVADRLAVTVMLSDAEDAVPPRTRDFTIVRGRIVAAEGWLGAFKVTVDGFAQAEPDGRGPLRFGAPADGARSECDLIVDLSGNAPLFPAPDKRDGYLRAEPRDPAGIARALLEATGLVGEFEKPLYVAFDAALCAHQRSGRPGCTRCLEVCPTAAIVPAGETVAIDPHVCAGCGACAAVCPSGAATYAWPMPDQIWRRLEALFEGWRNAGGGALRLLLHDEPGTELVALSARFGRGLPADVVPFALGQVTQIGHETILAALAMGAAEVIVLVDPRKAAEEGQALAEQVRLAAMLADGLGAGAARARLVETRDPDGLERALAAATRAGLGVEPIRPLGDRRSVTRQASRAIAAATGFSGEAVALDPALFPAGPPYGQVIVDTAACTMCLACVSTCPAGALLDNPDTPQLRFHEDKCLQCGICRSTCPEDAITLAPRYLMTEAARQAVVLNEEEPFACIECGKLFGTRSTVERIAEKLVGKHWMFADDSRARLIQMCDDCRIRAQYHFEDSPFRMGEPRRVRTTEDYLQGRVKDNGKGGDET